MKAVEFTSKIQNNRIAIPAHLKNELGKDRHVRVIVLIDESEIVEINTAEESDLSYFLKGYDSVDHIYDQL